MEEFKEKARALTCKECKYPAKSADAWPMSKRTNQMTGCAEDCVETQVPFVVLRY